MLVSPVCVMESFQAARMARRVDRGSNYPSWMTLSSRRMRIEWQSEDETEEENSQQDSQILRYSESSQKRKKEEETSFDCF